VRSSVVGLAVLLGLPADVSAAEPADGRCDPGPCPSAGASEPAGVVVVGAAVPEIRVSVGEILQLVLVDVEGRATAWALESGPPGLAVARDGSLDFRPVVSDVGRWRVNLRLWSEGAWSRRAALDLVVFGGDALPGWVRAPLALADLSLALGEEVGHPRRRLPIRACSLSLGAAGGGSSSRSSWTLPGNGVLLSGSPFLGASCDGGRSRGLWWSVGVDTAPAFSYLLQDQRVRHGLASTLMVGWTNEIWYLGAYGTAGATVLGLGPVVRWMAFQRSSGARHGPEVRLTWGGAGVMVLEGILAWNIRLGRPGERAPVAAPEVDGQTKNAPEPAGPGGVEVKGIPSRQNIVGGDSNWRTQRDSNP